MCQRDDSSSASADKAAKDRCHSSRGIACRAGTPEATVPGESFGLRSPAGYASDALACEGGDGPWGVRITPSAPSPACVAVVPPASLVLPSPFGVILLPLVSRLVTGDPWPAGRWSCVLRRAFGGGLLRRSSRAVVHRGSFARQTSCASSRPSPRRPPVSVPAAIPRGSSAGRTRRSTRPPPGRTPAPPRSPL